MADDRIDGRDVCDDPWIAQQGASLSTTLRERGAVLLVELFDANSVAFDKTGAGRIGVFALSAAGIDLVGAARKVVEVYGQTCSGDILSPNIALALATRREVLDALAVELAKLDAVRT